MEKTTIINLFLVLTLATSLLLVVPLASAQSTSPNIKVTLLNQDPDPVEQGDVVELRFKVENTGAASANEVQMQLLLDYPFSLYSGKSVQDIGRLKAGQTGTDALVVRYKVKVDENAAEGDNEIKIQLRIGEGIWQTYKDNEFLVDVKDYDVPDVKVFLSDSDIKSAGQRGTVTFDIANADKADIKFMQLTLNPSENYQILSPSNYAYIGDVTSDDTESQDFDIYISKEAKNEVILPISIQYRDTNDKRYEKSFMIKLKIYNSSELKDLGFIKKSNSAYIIAGIVIIATLLIFWRSRRKQR